MDAAALPQAKWIHSLVIPGSHGQPPVDGCLLAFDRAALDATAIDAEVADAHGIAWPPGIAESSPGRQREYLMGRLAAARALVPWHRDNARIGIGERREPLWPVGVIGSISHVAGFAAAAAAPATTFRSIGIDLERIAGGRAQSALRERVLHAHELALLDKVSSEKHAVPSDLLVTLAFSAKECLFKAADPLVRQFFGFEAARVCEISLEESRLTLEIMKSPGVPFDVGTCWNVSFQCVLPTARLWLSSMIC